MGEMRFQPNGGPAAVRHSTSTHRLTAEMMVLRIETKADFEEMRQAFEDKYRPVGPTEEFYLDIMLAASWRMRRARKIEAGLYALRSQALEEQCERPACRARPASWEQACPRSRVSS